MIDLTPELLTVIMLGGVLIAVLSGYLLGFAVGGLTLVVGYAVFGPRIVDVIYMRAYEIMTSHILLAVPMFVFMGVMLERSGTAEKLYDAFFIWFGSVKCGLAIVTVLMGTILAATTGVIAASVTLLTRLALPPMLNRGYSKSFATGAVAASGTLGILIPPSIMLLVYAPMAGISVGMMFFGAIVPGILLSATYIGYIVIRSFFQPHIVGPPVRDKKKQGSFVKKTWVLIVAIAPVTILIMSVLGTIFFGIASPTESAGMGAIAATLLTIIYRTFSLQVLKEVAMVTMKICGFLFVIVIMLASFSTVFLAGGGGEVMEDIILGVGGGRWGFFATTMLVIFVMGKFIDWIGILFILVPIITPIAEAAGFDPIWFSVMVCIALQTSFLTPPIAGAIFICQGACDPKLGVTLGDIIRGVLPYIPNIAVVSLLCTMFPQLITWLPGEMIG